MKNVFLVHIILPDVFTGQFYELVNKQRDVIVSLMEERVVLSYSLDMERKNIWCVIEVEEKKALTEVIKTFPIILHVELVVHELAYFDAAPVSMPELILN